jgi:aspartyl-tRNA(Asn)/glutamyl-tRNA(Gln) amidotransferase subunit A
MARSVADLIAMYEVISGLIHPTNDTRKSLWPQPKSDGLRGVRIGVPENYFFDHVEPDVDRLVREAGRLAGALGAIVTPCRVPDLEQAMASTRTIVRAEALELHRRHLEEHADQFGPNVFRRLRPHDPVTLEALQAARAIVEATQESIDELWNSFDVFLTPTVEITAPLLEIASSDQQNVRLTRLSYPWSLAHLPTLSLPCGLSGEHLPVGFQITGLPNSEWALLEMGLAVQTAVDWHRLRPPMETITA